MKKLAKTFPVSEEFLGRLPLHWKRDAAGVTRDVHTGQSVETSLTLAREMGADGIDDAMTLPQAYMFDRALTPDEIEKAERLLAERHGIALGPIQNGGGAVAMLQPDPSKRPRLVLGN